MREQHKLLKNVGKCRKSDWCRFVYWFSNHAIIWLLSAPIACSILPMSGIKAYTLLECSSLFSFRTNEKSWFLYSLLRKTPGVVAICRKNSRQHFCLSPMETICMEIRKIRNHNYKKAYLYRPLRKGLEIEFVANIFSSRSATRIVCWFRKFVKFATALIKVALDC